MSAVEVRDLVIAFDTPTGRKTILENVSLAVEEGQFVCLVGPSGVGKTTLIRCLSGLSRPTSGEIVVEGSRVDGPSPALALVAQDYSRSLLPWLKVAANVRFPLRSQKIAKADREARVTAALEAVGLAHARDSYVWQLSGGMQQRVSIARALAYQPRVLVMDEPFASVDAQTRADLEDLVLKLQRETGITVLLVTHDIDESVYLSDRVVVLGGRPASVREEIAIELGAERDQLTTKSHPEFVEYRSRVLTCIRDAALEMSA